MLYYYLMNAWMHSFGGLERKALKWVALWLHSAVSFKPPNGEVAENQITSRYTFAVFGCRVLSEACEFKCDGHRVVAFFVSHRYLIKIEKRATVKNNTMRHTKTRRAHQNIDKSTEIIKERKELDTSMWNQCNKLTWIWFSLAQPISIKQKERNTNKNKWKIVKQKALENAGLQIR